MTSISNMTPSQAWATFVGHKSVSEFLRFIPRAEVAKYVKTSAWVRNQNRGPLSRDQQAVVTILLLIHIDAAAA